MKVEINIFPEKCDSISINEKKDSDPIKCIPSSIENNDVILENIKALHSSLDGLLDLHQKYIVDLKSKIEDLSNEDMCQKVETDGLESQWLKGLKSTLDKVENYTDFSFQPEKIPPIQSSPPDTTPKPESYSTVKKIIKKIVEILS